MKTLKGKPIEGDLQTLYKYHFSPGGGYKVAAALAEANGMLNDLEVLIENRINDMHRLRYQVANTVTNDKMNYPQRKKRTTPLTEYLPQIATLVESSDSVIERHAMTGNYELNVEFKILGAEAVGDKPEYFCDRADFNFLARVGKHQVFSPKQVPAHLIDASFYDACFRAAMALHMAINMTWEKFRGFDTPFRKDVAIHHNLPNYPPITVLQKLVKYE